jgi:hypothetical protein
MCGARRVRRRARFLSSGVRHFYLAWECEQQDYSVFSLYLIDAWLPSQNGLFRDAPHRGLRIDNRPLTLARCQIGPLQCCWHFTSPIR